MQLPLPAPLGEPQGVPREAKRHYLSSKSWIFLRVSLSWACLGALEELRHAHQILHWISFGDWTEIDHIEFGADQMIYVKIRGYVSVDMKLLAFRQGRIIVPHCYQFSNSSLSFLPLDQLIKCHWVPIGTN
ncbi:hypothetical protein AMECASPLE_022172 [Ameca splendens]|uniref:Uncharacterized protein n=1 Tax=Ameca splendens TaxID=208324 RepID=A0ABV0ZNK7_9TELE